MPTHDYIIANGTGSAVRSDLNDALAAIVSNNSSATAPATTYAYMPWADTTAGVMKMRNGANSAWITLYQLDGEWTSIALENGTAAAPSLYFKDSGTDTGVYSSGTDAVDIATAGVRRVGISSTGEVTVYGGNVTLNAQGDLRFADSDSSNWVAFQAPATIASNVTWTLPSTDGTANQALQTNGSGTLSWGSFLRSVGGALTGDLTLNAQSDLRFADSDSSNWVAFQAPATVASNVTWTLPATDGTNGQSLQTNGSGTLSWASASLTIAGRSDVDGVHTTGTVTSGTTSLVVASATGIVAGMVVTGEGITPGTTVSSIASTTVTLSANAGATLSSDPVGFYDNTKALSPGSVGGQLCRAWVNFNGTGTVAIRASYNVSSITDNGAGDYTVNFVTSMPDANYSVEVSAGQSGGNQQGGINLFENASRAAVAPTTSAFRFTTFAGGSFVDHAYICASIFR